jgi:SAM-dependent methyltransferase
MNVSVTTPAAATAGNVASLPLVAIVRCARCGSELKETGTTMICRSCEQVYPITDGIPQLFVPNNWAAGKLDVTDIVKDFYEETPFPNYDNLDSRESLQAKARTGIVARLLDEQIPPNALVLEVGCGTGQLTNFLGMNWRRRAIGADLCMNSLRLGKSFRDRYAVINVDFVQMNLFHPPFADESMDMIISNGVLHHTADPECGFNAIAAKLNFRLPTLWRRRLIEIFGEPMAALDSRLRGDALNRGRWEAWFRDQYKHPHESKHSMNEVLAWFGKNRIEFVSSIPSIGDVEFHGDEPLFDSHPTGNMLDRFATEAELLLSGGADGGLYIMVGRKAG